MLQRLDFSLPDFTRLMWVNDLAGDVWAPRIRRITSAWLDIEWLAVSAGVRACGLTSVSPEQYVAKGGLWARHGLSGIPVAIQGATNYTYSSTPQKVESGKPFVFRVVVGKPQDIAVFQVAYDAADDLTIGRMLGYPACCQSFFQDVWVERKMVDTTWPMALASQTAQNGPNASCIEVNGPAEANILWRWMGVRAVSHLPCSFQCQATVALARRLIEVGRDAGYGLEMDWLIEILSWPAEWSALHGIAEIKTPVLKVSTRTDATPIRYAVRYIGSAYPQEGATGVVFPFRTPERRRLTTSRGFRRGLKNPIAPGTALPEWYAMDNGFNSRFIMDRAHEPIVELITAMLGEAGGKVLDLGCGNAALLKKLHDANPHIEPFGLELDSQRLEHARLLLPEFAANLWQGDIFHDESPLTHGQRYDLVLLMPGRLLETDAERGNKLRRNIREHSRHVLVYAYGEWLTRYSGLQGLARAAGFSLVDADAHSTATAGLAIVAEDKAHAGG